MNPVLLPQQLKTNYLKHIHVLLLFTCSPLPQLFTELHWDPKTCYLGLSSTRILDISVKICSQKKTGAELLLSSSLQNKLQSIILLPRKCAIMSEYRRSFKMWCAKIVFTHISCSASAKLTWVQHCIKCLTGVVEFIHTEPQQWISVPISVTAANLNLYQPKRAWFLYPNWNRPRFVRTIINNWRHCLSFVWTALPSQYMD